MIGSRFLRYLKPVPPRHMTRLNLFMGFMKNKIDDGIMRASHLTPNGYGSRLLMEIIKLADLETLLITGDPYKRTGEGLFPIVKDLEKPIDVRIGRHTTSSLFVKSKTPCFELVTPSRRKNPLAEIPFDQPYDHPSWKAIRPLRIVDMGTCDLRFSVHTDYLTYQKHGPTHVVYALDCFALVTKFIAYYRAQKFIANLDQTILDFIHNDVVIPTLLNDSLAIWLRNIYKQQLITASPLESHTSTIWDVITIDTIGSDFTGAMVDVQHLKDDLRKQSITAQTALASLLLSTKKQSFTEYYTELYETTRTPDQQPYVWVDCFKNLSWWEFIVMVTSYTPDHPDAMALQRDVVRDVRFWLMMKPWQEAHGSIPYKTMIRNRLEGLYTYLRTKA